MKAQGSKPAPRKDYSAVFTGETLCSVEAVNPTREEIIKFKGLEDIADRIQEPQYTNIELGGVNYTKLEFLLSFNPNEILGLETAKYEDKVFVNYPIFISSNIEVNKVGTKVRVIDDHNQSAWIKYDGSKTAEQLMDEAKQDPVNDGKRYYQQMDSKTVRFAKQGEVLLYDFIFNMTPLNRHSPDNQKELSDFVLGDNPKKGTETFDKIVKGDFKAVQEIVGSDMCKHTDGTVAKVGVMLGVRANDTNPDKVKFYQEVYANRRTVCTYREINTREIERGEHTTKLSAEAYDSLTDEQWGWKHRWNNSFKFKPFNKETYKAVGSSVDKDNEDDFPF